MIAMTSDIRPSLSVAEPTPLADSNTRLQAHAMLPVKCFASVAYSAQDSEHPASSARVEVGWLPAIAYSLLPGAAILVGPPTQFPIEFHPESSAHFTTSSGAVLFAVGPEHRQHGVSTGLSFQTSARALREARSERRHPLQLLDPRPAHDEAYRPPNMRLKKPPRLRGRKSSNSAWRCFTRRLISPPGVSRDQFNLGASKPVFFIRV